MPTPQEIHQAINEVHDQESFIRRLLVETLQWPIPEIVTDVDDMTVEWTDAELQADGLSQRALAGPVLQMQPITADQPWGVFLLEFANEDVFTTNRGLTGPLRKVLRGLAPKRRNRPAHLPAWDRQNLLFICTYQYKHFRFAYFKAPTEKNKAAPLSVFGWNRGDTALHTLCQYNLSSLVWSQDTSQPQWKEAFSIEKVTKNFFKQVAKLFTDLVGGTRKEGSRTYQGRNLLELPDTQTDTIRKEFAVRLIGRLIFCWFLKKKTSRAGIPLVPEEILSTAAIEGLTGVGGYYHSVLEPLFFELLNTPGQNRKKDYQKQPWSYVPFLNGGLFTPHEYDFYRTDGFGRSVHLNTLKVPDDWFRELFEVFERYNFTIDENTPVDIELSIEPEMLGRIFENLLAEINPETGETARKATGSYYTPRPIVEYMVDESLKQYLLTKTGISEDNIAALLSYSEQDSSALTEEQTETLVEALHQVKIIDPACGSGAFPLGILQKILLILQKLDPDSRIWLDKMLANIPDPMYRRELKKKHIPNYLHKLGIIKDCIFGVDIQPIAVEISKLRCFLSLIVDETVDDAKPNRGIEHLPNLEFKFVCANTLIGLPETTKKEKTKKGTFDQTQLFEATDKIDRLKELRDLYLTSYGQEKINIETEFRKVQSEMFQHNLDMAGQAKQTAKLSQWNPFSDEASSWFDPDWMFGIKDGFDIVIGNPPYRQIQKFSGQQCQRDWQQQGYATFTRTGDIYCLFYEKGIRLLKPNGCLCFISSNKWMRAAYGRKLRRLFSQETCPVCLIDFGGYKVFESATVDTNIIILQRADNNNPAAACTISADFTADTDIAGYLAQNAVVLDNLGADSWIICSKAENNIKNKIEAAGVPLKDWDISIYRGVLTGCNEAFIIDGAKKDELIAADPKNAEIIKPILRGRDIKRYKAQFADKWLIFIPWHFPLHNDPSITGASIEAERELEKQYPQIYKHLVLFKEKLSRRNKAEVGIRYEWYALQRCAATYLAEFEKEKILYQEMVQQPSFVYDGLEKYFCLDTGRLITGGSLKFLIAILNSRLFFFAIKVFYGGGALGGTGIRMKHTFFEAMPVPAIPQAQQRPFVELVDKILAKKERGQDTTTEEAKIDQMVYKLYGLTKEEIRIVEGAS